ncbi:MAG: asparaginase [Paracoccaceae bacterium]
MPAAEPLVEIWRGDLLESLHLGHAVIADETGQIVESWGDPAAIVYPRSSAKMLQALPLLESGAARAHELTDEQLALACASHQGAAIHTDRVDRWLTELGLTQDAFRCGPQAPRDKDALHAMIRAGDTPCRIHNNCSGKHAGFLTLNRHLGGDDDYHAVDHPVQKAGRAAMEDLVREESAGWGIDGCSAPNFAFSIAGMAGAMGRMAAMHGQSGTRPEAVTRLVDATMGYPELVAGEGRACTNLMRACKGKASLKTGAEGYFIAILPERKMGIALKCADGSTRAAECMIASLLVRLGVLDKDDPAAKQYRNPAILNFAGLHTGEIRPAAAIA